MVKNSGERIDFRTCLEHLDVIGVRTLDNGLKRFRLEHGLNRLPRHQSVEQSLVLATTSRGGNEVQN